MAGQAVKSAFNRRSQMSNQNQNNQGQQNQGGNKPGQQQGGGQKPGQQQQSPGGQSGQKGGGH